MAPPTPNPNLDERRLIDQQISQAIQLADEAERERELIKLLGKKRTAFVDARANELMSSAPFAGTPQEALQIANQEFETDFLMPLQNTYGTLPEKVFQLSAPVRLGFLL